MIAFKFVSECLHFVNVASKLRFSTAKLGENLLSPNDTSFTGRIISYLNNKSLNADTKLNINYGKYEENPDLPKLKLNIDLLGDTNRYRTKAQFYKFLNYVDYECCIKIDTLSTDEKFKILHLFLKNVPMYLLNTKYFDMAIESLYSDNESLTKQQLIELIFFIGIYKKTSNVQSMLKQCLRQLNLFKAELCIEQLCIICNSLFRTSTKINDKFLKEVANCVNNNLQVLNDPALLTSLIKVIRQNRYEDEELLTNIKCAIFFNQTSEQYKFITLCHILALFADNLYYDEDLLQLFINKGIQYLKEFNVVLQKQFHIEYIRAKDINRFLWSIAHLNYQHLDKSVIEHVIVKQIKERIDAGEYEHKQDLLIETLLYLWMLNYRAYDLIPQVITEDRFNIIQDTPHSPSKQRLNLLLTCIYYEDQNLYKKLNVQPPRFTTYLKDVQYKKRPVLQRVFDNLKVVCRKGRINRFETGLQVPHINVVGITGYEKKIYKAVHIEVLDEFTAVKNAQSLPSGMLQLKLRILDKLEEGVVVVDAEEIDDLTEAELQQYLLESIELVA